MRLYTIFDDFDPESIAMLRDAGIDLTIHPKGVPRPDKEQMTVILREYDGVIIGTSQKISEDMFEGIETPRLIGTASVGTDHIRVPEDKRHLVHVFNAPKASAYPVAEYTFAAILSCTRRISEGAELYLNGRDNKALSAKPEELAGKTLGVVGAGNISGKIIEFGQFFGMNVLCWTRSPEKHHALKEKGVRFVSLPDLAGEADIISVNLPSAENTRNIISTELIQHMKPDAVFVSVSRRETMDLEALVRRAGACPNSYTCLDLDPNDEVRDLIKGHGNIIVTPHIAGGTKANRIRMFQEATRGIIEYHERV